MSYDFQTRTMSVKEERLEDEFPMEKEMSKNVYKPVYVEPFDVSQLFSPPYSPPVIRLPGPGLPWFPDIGKYSLKVFAFLYICHTNIRLYYYLI